MHENKFTQEVGHIIRYHRKKAGLTQQELARLAGVGKTAVYDIEHNKLTVQLQTLLKLCHVLNIDIQMNSPIINYFWQQHEE